MVPGLQRGGGREAQGREGGREDEMGSTEG